MGMHPIFQIRTNRGWSLLAGVLVLAISACSDKAVQNIEELQPVPPSEIGSISPNSTLGDVSTHPSVELPDVDEMSPSYRPSAESKKPKPFTPPADRGESAEKSVKRFFQNVELGSGGWNPRLLRFVALAGFVALAILLIWFFAWRQKERR
ncbi:MAG: hypothetical protein OEW12_04935 [Deltaproteobacteria bacterium]|nr:hypothetical protein [Deltaproteobacteria bacterium]